MSQIFVAFELFNTDLLCLFGVYSDQSMTAIKNDRLKKEVEVKPRGAQKPHFNNQGSSPFGSSCDMVIMTHTYFPFLIFFYYFII